MRINHSAIYYKSEYKVRFFSEKFGFAKHALFKISRNIGLA